MIASPPKASTALFIRTSSVATTTRETSLARRTPSTTGWIIGLPAIGASGFPGKRTDACRAGITAKTFVESEFAINSPAPPADDAIVAWSTGRLRRPDLGTGFRVVLALEV